MSAEADDRAWMAQALALGSLGEGTASPNPRVGCVLVRDGIAVGRGFHRRAGEPHAEAVAVREAGEATRGATLYVNLEPCAHHGRTPPCAELLVERGVARVVAAMRDPDPRVDGRGFERLRRAGIRVDIGPLAEEAAELNAAFIHWHRHHRPRVTLKAAASLDGLIAVAEGESRWITGPAARRFAHRLRARHDAVLVGGGTVRRDDPLLTVRLPGLDVRRLRAVISPTLDLPAAARLFGDGAGPVVVYTGAGSAAAQRRALDGRAEIVDVPPRGDGLELGAVLDDLGARGIQSLLVEGGGRTLGAFLAAGLADDIVLFGAPVLFGARGGTPLIDLAAAATPAHGWRVRVRRRMSLGEDVVLVGRIEGH